MADIKIYGNPILRKRSKPVTDFNGRLKDFIDQLIVDMKENDGVGLAAPQVGESIRVAVVDVTLGENDPYVLVNPEVTWFSEDEAEDEEGCLSLPDIRAKVPRPFSVTVSAFDEKGRQYTIKNAGGFLARALQHEIDHLNGILFVDRIRPVYRQLISGKLKKLAKSQRDKT